MSYARAHAVELGIDPDFYKNMDIHIHVPAGATPKDGPSAGVTLTTALVSALTGKVVAPDLCMTGEVTLRGNVLPVGGVREKILAAVARGIKNVAIPLQNAKDLEDVPADLLKQIKVHTVPTLSDVFKLAFGTQAFKAFAIKGSSGRQKSARLN